MTSQIVGYRVDDTQQADAGDEEKEHEKHGHLRAVIIVRVRTGRVDSLSRLVVLASKSRTWV